MVLILGHRPASFSIVDIPLATSMKVVALCAVPWGKPPLPRHGCVAIRAWLGMPRLLGCIWGTLEVYTGVDHGLWSRVSKDAPRRTPVSDLSRIFASANWLAVMVFRDLRAVFCIYNYIMLRNISRSIGAFFEAIPPGTVWSPAPKGAHIRGALLAMFEDIGSVLDPMSARTNAENQLEYQPVQELARIWPRGHCPLYKQRLNSLRRLGRSQSAIKY